MSKEIMTKKIWEGNYPVDKILNLSLKMNRETNEIFIKCEEAENSNLKEIGSLTKNKSQIQPNFNFFTIMDGLKDGDYILYAQKKEGAE